MYFPWLPDSWRPKTEREVLAHDVFVPSTHAQEIRATHEYVVAHERQIVPGIRHLRSPGRRAAA